MIDTPRSIDTLQRFVSVLTDILKRKPELLKIFHTPGFQVLSAYRPVFRIISLWLAGLWLNVHAMHGHSGQHVAHSCPAFAAEQIKKANKAVD